MISTVDYMLETLKVDLVANGFKFDNALIYGVPVIVHVQFSQGEAVKLGGSMEDAVESIPDELTVTKILTKKTTHLIGDICQVEIPVGTDIKDMLTGHEVDAIADALLARQGV